MLRNAAFIAAKETKSFLREREIYFFSFAIPVAFMYFIGTVTSQSSGGVGAASKDPIALEKPENAGFLADQLEQRLEQNGLVVQRPESPQAAAG